jgi:hypothetical protein
LGVTGLLSPGGERMAVLAGVHDSFARAQRLMNELVGWTPDDDVIRRRTHAAARRAAAERPERRDAWRFAIAKGGVELEVDAGKVPTTGGWRDVQVAVFARREPGEPTPTAEWADRELPEPSFRSVVAAVEEAGDFTARVRREADRLNATTAADATVLGDGAEWIWNLAAEVLPQAEGVLDVFHGAEHVSDAVKAVWTDPGEAKPRREAGVAILLAEGKPGVDRWIAGLVYSPTCQRTPTASRCGAAPPTWRLTRPAWTTPTAWPEAARSAAAWSRGRTSNWSTDA